MSPKTIKVSASKLIKQSAKQIVYFNLKWKRYRQRKPVTDGEKEGSEQQLKVSTSKFIEMRGTYELGNILIFFAFDEIIVNGEDVLIIEHKSMDNNEIEDWYLHYSIIQVAFYSSLAKDIDDYYTACFLRKTHKTNYLNLRGKKRCYKLIFTHECNTIIEYEIKPIFPEKIIDFYIGKLNSTLNNSYDEAVEWDNLYKRKEWDCLRDFIDVTQTN